MMMLETIPMTQPNARGARLTVIGQHSLQELQNIIAAHWRHNMGTASKEEIKLWMTMIDQLEVMLQ
jgi:hypothetical protein